jgi:hypothetical protein
MIAATLPAPCWRCGGIIGPFDAFTVGHIIDAAVAPELELEPSNWKAEHPRCNYSAGARAGNARRRGKIKPTSRDW